jgi:hypothetical protein
MWETKFVVLLLVFYYFFSSPDASILNIKFYFKTWLMTIDIHLDKYLVIKIVFMSLSLHYQQARTNLEVILKRNRDKINGVFDDLAADHRWSLHFDWKQKSLSQCVRASCTSSAQTTSILRLILSWRDSKWQITGRNRDGFAFVYGWMVTNNFYRRHNIFRNSFSSPWHLQLKTHHWFCLINQDLAIHLYLI